MSIKKPSAVDSPYVTTDTTPVRLVSGPIAGGGVNTVAATVSATVGATANADANTASPSTGSNVSYYASGIEGIAGLANYGRVFDGANVYVTLEQPQYITYNQTFTGSNIGNSISVTGNITTSDGYFIGDGSQLTGISSSGNFIVNGNSKVDIVAPGGGVTVDTNGNIWTFNVGSQLTAPGGSRWQNQANADAYFTSSLDGYVHLQSLFADGNVGSEMFLQHGLATITAHSLGANTDYTWTFDNGGNLTLPGNTFQINYANGNQVTLGSGASNYIVNGNSYANIATANGSLTININGGNTWTFNSSSQLTAPGGSRWQNQANADAYFTSSLDGYVHLQSLFADGNVGSEMFLQHGLATITAHSVGANTDYTWTFDNSANLGLPAGSNISDTTGTLVIEANAGSALNLRTTSGNAYSEIYSNATVQAQISITDQLTGANPAWAVIEADMANINTPTAVVILKPGDTGDEVRWTFDAVGNLTVPGNILGSGNILIAPDSASSSSYLDIYLTGGPDIHIASNDNSIVIGRDTGANIFVGNDGEVSIRTDNGATPQVWNFDDTGNLTLPGNIIAINYANGNRVTGNVTFRDEIVIGTGTSNLVSGLYLAPSSSSADANMYLRVRGNINDEPTHIHFDTGNNQYYNQFIGDDNKYIQLANTGNIVINSNDAVGNSAQWIFAANGNLTTPGISGNISGANVISANIFSATGNAISGNVLTAGLISATANITGGNILTGGLVSATGNITAANFVGNGNTLSNVATQVTGSWTVPVGNSTQSFTVSNIGTYSMWVDCNITNGILAWNATATVTNNNVPVVGAQYAWVYNGGGTPIDFTSIPDQFTGTANTIVRSSVAPSATTNRFDFGINNTSGNAVTVRYGYTKIS